MFIFKLKYIMCQVYNKELFWLITYSSVKTTPSIYKGKLTVIQKLCWTKSLQYSNVQINLAGVTIFCLTVLYLLGIKNDRMVLSC